MNASIALALPSPIIKMTEEQAQKLLKLYNSGYRIKFLEGPYLNSFGRIEERDGRLFYEDQTYCNIVVEDKSIHSFGVYKVLENWAEVTEW